MERDSLSMRQLMALLWAGLMGPAAELLPGSSARAGGIGGIGLAAAGAAMLFSGWIFWQISRESQSLACGFIDVLGPLLGKTILFIYMVWFQLLLVMRLRQSAQRLLRAGQRDGAVWFFVGVLGLMALWLARGRLGAFGRAGELMFVVLTVTAGAVLALALLQVRGENLIAEWKWGWNSAWELVLPGSGVLGYGLFAAFLVQPQKIVEDMKRKWMGWTVSACSALIVAQTIILGVFGPELTRRLHAPFYQLAKGVRVEGAFQRVESVVAAVWTFSDLVLLAGILWAMREIGRVLWPKVARHSIVTVSVLVGIVGAVAVLGERGPVYAGLEWTIPTGGILLAIGVPLLSFFTKKLKER